jgi:hypothetical protein
MRSIMWLGLLAPALLIPVPAMAQAGGAWRVTGDISGKAFTLDCQFDAQGPKLGGVCVDVSTGESKAKPGKSHVLSQGSVQGQDVRWAYSTKVMMMSVEIAFVGKVNGARMTGTVSAKGRQGTFSAIKG